MKKETLDQLKKDYDIVKIDGNQITHTRKDGSVGVFVVNDEPTMTQQQFKDECDINHIIKKHGGDLRMVPPHVFVRSGKGVYGDFSDAKDFQNSMDALLAAEDAFMTLDARVRARFENDPQKLFAFLNDRKNMDEAIQLGLIEKPAATPPQQPPQNPPTPNTNPEPKTT